MSSGRLTRAVRSLFRRRQKPPVPRGVERLCVGTGSRAQMMLKAREVTRAPILGVGIALTTGQYEMEVEPMGDEPDGLWRLMVWIDRDADYPEHRGSSDIAELPRWRLGELIKAEAERDRLRGALEQIAVLWPGKTIPPSPDPRDVALAALSDAEQATPRCDGSGEFKFNPSRSTPKDPQLEDYAECPDCAGTGDRL